MNKNNLSHTDAEQMELAALYGHPEARDRLEALGRTDEQINELEKYSNGFIDFARCVAEAERWADRPDETD